MGFLMNAGRMEVWGGVMLFVCLVWGAVCLGAEGEGEKKREFKACFEGVLGEATEEIEMRIRQKVSHHDWPVEWLAGHADKVIRESDGVDVAALEGWVAGEEWHRMRRKLALCVMARAAGGNSECLAFVEKEIRAEKGRVKFSEVLGYLPLEIQRSVLLLREGNEFWAAEFRTRMKLLSVVGNAKTVEQMKAMEGVKRSEKENLEEAVRVLGVKCALGAAEQAEWERVGVVYWKAWMDTKSHQVDGAYSGAVRLKAAGVLVPVWFLNVRIENGDEMAGMVAAFQDEVGCVETLANMVEKPRAGMPDFLEALALMKNAKARELTTGLLMKHPTRMEYLTRMMGWRGDAKTAEMLKVFLKDERFKKDWEGIENAVKMIEGRVGEGAE